MSKPKRNKGGHPANNPRWNKDGGTSVASVIVARMIARARQRDAELSKHLDDIARHGGGSSD
jgi:hypothetical protein